MTSIFLVCQSSRIHPPYIKGWHIKRYKLFKENIMKRSSWESWEFAFLEEAYRQKYSLKEIATFLERSLAAINKVLIRSRIRERYQIERKATSQSFKKYNTLEMIYEELKRKGHSISLKKISDRPQKKEKKNPDVAWLLRSEIVFEPGDMPIKKSKKKEVFHFQTIDIVLEWLKDQGFTVRRVPESEVLPYIKSGHTGPWFEVYIPFLFKKSPRILKSQSQLLLLVNKMRLKKSLPPYYLSDVTEW